MVHSVQKAAMQKSLQCLLLGNNAKRPVKPRLAGLSGQKDDDQISVPKNHLPNAAQMAHEMEGPMGKECLRGCGFGGFILTCF